MPPAEPMDVGLPSCLALP